MKSDARCVGHAEEKEKKKKKLRPFGLVRRAEIESHFWLLCVSSRVSKKH